MRKKAQFGISGSPIPIPRPEGTKFSTSKSRTHANHGVMPSYGVASDDPKKLRHEIAKSGAPWLASQKSRADFFYAAKNFLELGIVEVMEKKIAQDQIESVVALGQKFKNVTLNQIKFPTQRCKLFAEIRSERRLSIEEKNLDASHV